MAHIIKAILSNPLDGNLQNEIKDLIKTMLATFTTSYVKNYALALAKMHMDNASAAPGPAWKLLERPPREVPYKEGYVVKEGGFFTKKMNKRYFVVRPDYLIDYYLTEEDAKKPNAKPRCTLSLAGYSVNDDANNGMIQRLMKLAEKMGVDTSELPKPKEYPQHTMELHHSRRESYYIHCEDHEEFKQWLDQIKTCVWRAQGFKNKDQCHMSAFNQAIVDSRYKLGRWGWWSWGGTEEQVLSDLISDEIEWTILGRVYAKINGPWAVRWAIRNQVLKVIGKLVNAGVTPAWKAMSAAVEELRPKIEPTIKEMVEPIGKAKLDLMTKIKDSVMSMLTPLLQEHVNPHLAKIVEVIQSPMTDAFKHSFKFFDEEAISKFNFKDTAEENKKEFHHLDHLPYSWKMYEITRKADEMYEPLWALNIIFPDIYPWSLIWTAHDELRSKLDNAIYTFEQRLIEEQEKGQASSGTVDKLKESVMADFMADGNLARMRYYRHIIKKIVMPPLNKLAIPAAEAILSPIASAIPEPMQQFLDINDMFQQIVNGVVDDSIATVLG
eukprot:TRINITY_DN29_c0_g1_i1.p1 TRINITY_DN29_c0_g1~~TRINITY_DN29_c0_g1_i1.p1  ORF type:complete len:553 (+),score=198.09 TRINITY_DN29_c0_g1_i1:77-1735(+)